MNKDAPVVVARTSTESEAVVIKSLLESYNIGCHYMSELPHRIYPLSGEGLAEIRIYVPAAMADEARRILAEYRRREAPLRLVDDDEA
jgi:hypothetical protein